MGNIFAANIKSVLEKHFGKNANDIFDKSQLIQYINEKTRSAPATLIDKRISWKEIDDNNVNATFTNNGISKLNSRTIKK